jgi:hypothetical protein
VSSARARLRGSTPGMRPTILRATFRRRLAASIRGGAEEIFEALVEVGSVGGVDLLVIGGGMPASARRRCRRARGAAWSSSREANSAGARGTRCFVGSASGETTG